MIDLRYCYLAEKIKTNDTKAMFTVREGLKKIVEFSTKEGGGKHRVIWPHFNIHVKICPSSLCMKMLPFLFVFVCDKYDQRSMLGYFAIGSSFKL